jgi:cyclic pyranopterin phosphate synthase
MRRSGLTHLDAAGRARMVDVSAKPTTHRRARAEGFVRLAPATLRLLRSGKLAKGDAFAVARLAGLQAGKRASEWIPLCHPVRLDDLRVDVEPASGPRGRARVRVEAEARALDRTGVEMEALVAVSAAALTLYDMVKAVDRAADVEGVRLLEKEGGRSGRWVRARSPRSKA